MRFEVKTHKSMVIDGVTLETGSFNYTTAAIKPGHSVHEPNAPLLVLIGMNDDWPGPAGCSELKESYKNTKYELAVTIYPNVYHAFDYEEYRGGVNYEEHHMEYDPAAASDAISQTRDFLAKYLGSE